MISVTSARASDRVGRYPKHTFKVREIPFAAIPFMIAPVRVGETLQSLFFESRVISDPVLSPIIGWKKQYFFFYVKMSDLMLDAMKDMFVDDANADISATYGVVANDTAYYTAKGGIDYLKRCVTRITDEYFRDEGEVFADYLTAEGYPIVQIRDNGFLDTLTDKDDMPEGAAIAGATDAGDLERIMLAFEQLRALGMVQMTYADFLRQSGVNVERAIENKPELLDTFSDYQYPSNTVDPATGNPTSAVSWVFKNGFKDPKMFKEPGFVVGISVTRPKVYYSGLAGNMAAHLGRAWDWAPFYTSAAPQTTLKYFTGDTGPLGDRTTAPDHYWLDTRDVFLHGDQFQNITPFAAVPVNVGLEHQLALPTGDTFNFKYPTETMCKSFFVTPASAFYVKQDGYASLNIKGNMREVINPHEATV